MAETPGMFYLGQMPLHLWTCELADKFSSSKVQQRDRHWVPVTEIPIPKGREWKEGRKE